MSRSFQRLRSLLKTVMLALFWLVISMIILIISKLRWYAFLGILLAGWTTLDNLKFWNKAVTVEGVYTGDETVFLTRYKIATTSPIFSYVDSQGAAHINTPYRTVSRDHFILGETVILLVNSDKPSQIEIKNEFNPLMPGGGIAGLGILVLFFPYWVKQHGHKWRRNLKLRHLKKPLGEEDYLNSITVDHYRNQNEHSTIRRMR